MRQKKKKKKKKRLPLALYLHYNSQKGGIKYSLRKECGWITHHDFTKGVFSSVSLLGLLQIGTVPLGLEKEVDQRLRAYDNSLDEIPGLNCHVATRRQRLRLMRWTRSRYPSRTAIVLPRLSRG
jgi:hypothetical protein